MRVLVVDDSALMRKLIPQMLAADESIEVVGTAMDGNFCLKKIEELKPHVVTLDLEMPGMNGIDTLKEIMRRQPVPVIVFSSHSTEGASVTMKALGLGAFDFVAKPSDASAHMPEIAARTDRQDQGSGRVQAEATHAAGSSAEAGEGAGFDGRRPTRSLPSAFRPEVRRRCSMCFRNCRRTFPGAIVVVQHMPEGFTEMFARRLDELCPLRVKEAQSGDVLHAGPGADLPGQPAHESEAAAAGRIVVLSDEPRVNGHRPPRMCCSAASPKNSGRKRLAC